jgi:hypothetical protein
MALVLVKYVGKLDALTLNVTSDPLTLPKGEPVEVGEGLVDTLTALTEGGKPVVEVVEPKAKK